MVSPRDSGVVAWLVILVIIVLFICIIVLVKYCSKCDDWLNVRGPIRRHNHFLQNGSTQDDAGFLLTTHLDKGDGIELK